MATFQPSPGFPTTRSALVRAPVKNTSQNSPSPSMLVIGRICTPGWSAGISSRDSPWCRGASGSVRHSTYSQSADAPNVIQTFCPSMTHPPASSRAWVRTEARSEPASGSLKPWPQNSSAAVIRGRNRAFCSAVPNISRVGPNRSCPWTPRRYGACARAYSYSKMIAWASVAPRPPYSGGQVRPSQRPADSSFSQRSRTSQAVESSGPPTPRCAANSPVRCSSSQRRTSAAKGSSSGRIWSSMVTPPRRWRSARAGRRAGPGDNPGCRTWPRWPWPA